MRYGRIENGAVTVVYDVDDSSQLERYYDPAKAVLIVALPDAADLGWVYQDGNFLTPCPGEFYSIQNGAWVEDTTAAQKASIQAQLAALDELVSRGEEDLYTQLACTPVYAPRAAAITQKQALRAQLAALG